MVNIFNPEFSFDLDGLQENSQAAKNGGKVCTKSIKSTKSAPDSIKSELISKEGYLGLVLL